MIGSREPNKIPKGNKLRCLNAVVEARSPNSSIIMTQYQFIKTQDEDSGIAYIYSEFEVANITYMAIFSSDKDTLALWEEDETIASIIRNKTVYSIKFAVKEYIEMGNNDLYAPPINCQ